MIAGIVVKSTGFDLVIERLFVSSMEAPKALHERTLFRSRNRETFRFKIRMLLSSDRLIDCFNLAIEVLLISSVKTKVQSIEPTVSISQSRFF